jgi:tetratricopeptide (TPR) repeat protein
MTMTNKKYLYLIVAIISFLVYYNSLNNDFVFDDESVVQNNQAIQKLSNIPKFFTAEEGFHKVIGRYYRPVVSSLYAVDFAIWGMNPFGFHLTNVVIHVIASLLLLLILMKLFGSYKYGLLSALIGALIFAVHPIHTEAVSWVSGRTDSLATLFFLLSFLFYLKFSDKGNDKKFLWISLIAYFLGLLSKEMIVTMPVLLFLYDFFFRKRSIDWFKKNYIPYVLFISLTIIFVAIRYMVLKDVVERSTYMYFYGAENSTAVFTMLKTIPVYFRLLLFPINLLYHYNGVYPDSTSIGDVKVLFSLVFIIVLLIVSWFLYKKYSEVSFAILFFFVSLLPVMNFIPTMNFMAERFLYLTSFGLSVLISYLFIKYVSEKNKSALISMFLLIVIIFGYLTYKRNADWKNNDTLYSTAEGKDGSVLLVNAGNIYANKKNYDEAEKRYRRAIEIRDNSVLAHHNLGLIFLLKGNLDSAEIQIKKGLSIDSLSPDGYFQLSNIYQQKGRISEAITALEKLQLVVPNYRESKGILDMLKSNPSSLEKNIPNNVSNNQQSILEKRSYQYYQDGKFEEAIKDLDDAIKLNPSAQSGYLNNIAMCYLGLKDNNKAKEYFNKSIEKDTKNINAYGGLAELYLKEKNNQKAKEMFEKILSINPQDQNARMKLDSLKQSK